MRRRANIFLLTGYLLLSAICGLSVNAQDWHQRDSLLTLMGHSGQDTARIALLLKLANFQIFKPGELKTDLDSAVVYIEAAKTLNTRLQSPLAAAWIVLTESYLLKEHPEDRPKGKAMAEKALSMLLKTSDPFHTGEAYRAVSEYYRNDDTVEVAKRIALLEKSVAQFASAGAISDEAAGYQLLGELYENDSLALSSLLKALSLFQSVQYPLLQGVYGNLSSYYYQIANLKQALNYAILALNTADAQHDTTMQLCELANQTGILINRLGQQEKAIPYYVRALERAEAFRDNRAIYMIASNLGITYVRLHQPTRAKAILEEIAAKYTQPKDEIISMRIASCFLEVYIALQAYDLATPYVEKVRLALKRNPAVDIGFRSEMNLLLSNYYLATHQFTAAAAQLKSNDSLGDAAGDAEKKAVSESLWFRLDTAEGKYADAISHLLKTKAINDSTFTATKSQQIHQLEVEFDTKKKEDKISLLNEQTRLEQVRLQQATLIKNVSIAGVILALVIAALLFRQNRIKQKNSRLILRKNHQLQHLVSEKEWLLREVHHRVKNNLHTVICLLESQAAYLENDALLAIQNSGHRIYAMSLIHQKLYQTEDIRAIDMANYIKEFVRYLQDSFGSPSTIRIALNIEPITLGVAQAIPLGLIINESVTNSFKYAFPGGMKGVITVRLFRKGSEIVLEIVDDGIGFNYNPEATDSSSLGLELMKGLAREIRGMICVDGSSGTMVTISFELGALDTAVREANQVLVSAVWPGAT